MIRCLDILFPTREYENDLSTDYHRMVLLLIMRPLLNFQYWQKVLYFPATRRFPEIHIVVYNKKRLSIGYKY